MYIFTDSPNRADQLFSREFWWNNRYNDKIINYDYDQLVSQLLKNPSFTEMKTGLGWHSLIHTKHSVVSQFDSLNNFVKIGLDVPDGILCYADSGQNFHGQENRTWEAKEGNIHLSVFLSPEISSEKMKVDGGSRAKPPKKCKPMISKLRSVIFNLFFLCVCGPPQSSRVTVNTKLNNVQLP